MKAGPTKATKVKKKLKLGIDIITEEPKWMGLDTSQVVNGKLCLSGCGSSQQAKVMVVAPNPSISALTYKKASSDQAWRAFYRFARDANLDMDSIYFTYLVKHAPRKAKISSVEIKESHPQFMMEVETLQPDLIVCLGRDVWAGLGFGEHVNFSAIRGTITDLEVDMPTYEWNDEINAYDIRHSFSTQVQAMALFNPGFLDIAPKETQAFEQDLNTIKLFMEGQRVQEFIPDYTVITKASEVKELREALQASPEAATISLDCEWHGDAWYKEPKQLRTVQLCIDDKLTVVIALCGELNGMMVQKMDDIPAMTTELKLILEQGNIGIIGHNVKEDALWLHACLGINIRPKVVFDTMLAETLINQNGPFGLEDVARKYTDIPRWAVRLEAWKKTVDSRLHSNGYGYIPDAILEPYSAVDVIATYRVAMKQLPELEKLGYLKPRGTYTSLFDSTMKTQDTLNEIEEAGLPVDTELLDQLIELFEDKVERMKADLIAEVDWLIHPDKGLLLSTEEGGEAPIVADPEVKGWNPDSGDDVIELLFKTLGITPFKTTKAAGGKLWADAIMELGMDDDDAMDGLAAATDSQTLTILIDEHPIIEKILNYRKVAQIRKTWLRTPEVDPDGYKRGGLYGNIGSNNALHPSLAMACSTGRMSSRNPNSQNFPKKAQKFLTDIFKPDLETNEFLRSCNGKVPTIRNVVIPPPGYVIMEGDFVQAELFVLAGLSGDVNMWRALTTPGLDLHTKTALDSFRIKMLLPDKQELTEDMLLSFAGEAYRDNGGGSLNFNKNKYESELDGLFSTVSFVDATGHTMTYKDFKNSARISAKSLNFGCAVLILVIYFSNN